MEKVPDRDDRLPVDGNQDTGALKLIAMFFMFCDHAGKMLFSGERGLRVLGRIAFPVYAWCLVVGACHTRSMPRYILRTLLVGLVSQPLYMLALNHTWNELNVFFTLTLGLCAVWGIQERKWCSQWWGPVLAIVAAAALGPDYGWRGVLVIILMYICRHDRKTLAAMMVAFCLFWGQSSSTVGTVFGITVTLPSTGILNSLLSPWTRIQALAVLSLPLILVRAKKNFVLPKWIGYLIYPAHLVLLYLAETLM